MYSDRLQGIVALGLPVISWGLHERYDIWGRGYWQAREWNKATVKIGGDAPKARGKSDGTLSKSIMEEARIS
jgi:hypothetical protein